MSRNELGLEISGALSTIDRRFMAWATVWAALALVAFGVLNAIIPTPFFQRPIEPEPFAIATWLLSAPLIGLIGATYTAPVRAFAGFGKPAVPLSSLGTRRNGTTLGSLAGFGTFLAIGCPVCNKVALVLLGTSGALSVYAPLQPIIGAVSLGLLAVTVGWRFRLRVRAEACAR